MSQAKVDRYKQEKANRKKNVKKQKRNSIFKKTLGVLGLVALVALIILSAKVLKGDFEESTVATTTLSEAQMESLKAALGVSDTDADEETSEPSSEDEEDASSDEEETTPADAEEPSAEE